MKGTVIKLAIPTLIFAKILIEVRIDQNEKSIRFRGNDIEYISEVERDTFQLHSENLNKCASEYFDQVPGDVYFDTLTQWGDIYKVFNWTPVTRSLLPVRGKLLSFDTVSSVIRTQIYNNTSKSKAKFQMQIRQEMENSIYGSWHKIRALSVKDMIFRYNITTKSNVSMRVQFASKWGEDFRKSEPVIVGSEDPVEVSLEPAKTVITDLVATKMIAKVKVEYLASLFGAVVVNFPQHYKGHHFWALDIQTFMDTCGLRNFFECTQVVVLDCYTDSKLVVRDAEDQEVVNTISLEVFEKNS